MTFDIDAAITQRFVRSHSDGEGCDPVISAMKGLEEEAEAVENYRERAAHLDGRDKEMNLDLAREEAVHLGEHAQRLSELDPDLSQAVQEGMEEARTSAPDSVERVKKSASFAARAAPETTQIKRSDPLAELAKIIGGPSDDTGALRSPYIPKEEQIGREKKIDELSETYKPPTAEARNVGYRSEVQNRVDPRTTDAYKRIDAQNNFGKIAKQIGEDNLRGWIESEAGLDTLKGLIEAGASTRDKDMDRMQRVREDNEKARMEGQETRPLQYVEAPYFDAMKAMRALGGVRGVREAVVRAMRGKGGKIDLLDLKKQMNDESTKQAPENIRAAYREMMAHEEAQDARKKRLAEEDRVRAELEAKKIREEDEAEALRGGSAEARREYDKIMGEGEAKAILDTIAKLENINPHERAGIRWTVARAAGLPDEFVKFFRSEQKSDIDARIRQWQTSMNCRL